MIREIVLTLEFSGTILIALTALMVYSSLRSEHKVDRIVFRTIRMETFAGYTGIILLTIAFLMNIFLL